MTNPEAFPLSWPALWPRTKHPRASQFSMTFGRARHGLLHELRLLGATDILISSNLPLRRDGQLYAYARKIDDPGVAVYFRLRGEDRCIPADKWLTIQDNIHAIALSIGALRGLSRWGADQSVDAAFAGFGALPATATSGTPWWEVLQVDPQAGRDEIVMAYRRLVKQHHPDAGGSAERFHAVQAAYEQAVAS